MSASLEEFIREDIRALSAYHVPDATGMVKLDAMENPYPLPDAVREEVAALVKDAALNRYPDPGAERLKLALRRSLELPAAADILLGNGSDEIIQMLVMAVARPGAVVLGVEPSFVMFRMICALCGARFQAVPLRPDFSLDSDALLKAIAHHRPALVFIAYPNNPTGNSFDEEALEAVLTAAPGFVVIDEAYHSFARRTFVPRLAKYPNLLVMRTLSKSGLAGLRLGLVAGRQEWLTHVEKVRLPYNVNVLTQLVAEKVLQYQPLLDQQADAIRGERARLFSRLQELPALKPYPSDANFILFRVPDADRVFASLKQQRVLVKNLNGHHAALAGCLRVTVGTPAENDRFFGALVASRP